MKVCVIKTSSMGDVIHTLPALTDAQWAISDLSIDWVVEENFTEIPRWHSAVKQIIPIALRRWRKSILFRLRPKTSGNLTALSYKPINMML